MGRALPRECVWDYPRPPRLEATAQRIEIYTQGICLACTERAYRVLETSHPPVYYLPPQDIQLETAGAPPCTCKVRVGRNANLEVSR